MARNKWSWVLTKVSQETILSFNIFLPCLISGTHKDNWYVLRGPRHPMSSIDKKALAWSLTSVNGSVLDFSLSHFSYNLGQKGVFWLNWAEFCTLVHFQFVTHCPMIQYHIYIWQSARNQFMRDLAWCQGYSGNVSHWSFLIKPLLEF